MLLSIPYVRGISSFIDKYKDNIYDVYFTDDVLLTARPKFDDSYYHLLYKEIDYIRSLGISVTFLLNSLLLNKPTEKKLWTTNNNTNAIHLENIKDKYDTITINNLMHLYDDELMSAIKDKQLKCSVNNHIDSLYKIDEMFKIAKWDIINVDRTVNRNNKLLNLMCEDLRNRGAKSVVLVNEGCHWNCVFKEFCDLSMVDKNQTTKFDCNSHYNQDRPESYLKTPLLFHHNLQHINADIFKISGRFNDKSNIEKRIRHYLYGDDIKIRELIDKPIKDDEDMGDVLYSTLYKYNMIEHLYNCKNDCLHCSKCDKIRGIL